MSKSEKLKASNYEKAGIDLTDEFSVETNWDPMRGGGANFSTHKLYVVSDDRIEFVASNGGVLFALIFAAVGAGLPILSFFSGDPGGFICTGLFGLPFLAVGIYMFINGTKPIVFDAKHNKFWTGYEAPEFLDNETSCSLNKIHAIQLIEEWISGSKSSYYSYELNLVLKTGDRIHVVDHGNKDQMGLDANRLGAFLEVPVWDETSNGRRPFRGGFSINR